jgi:rubrerythrin
MKTSQQWWNEVKADEVKLIDWLKDQYHGEITAADRIVVQLGSLTDKGTTHNLLNYIANQERQHAEWVGELLKSRGVEPSVLEKDERYWDTVLPGITDFQYGAAVAAHAEEMRLERIKVISDDLGAPTDIRAVFSRILIDERMHVAAFNSLAGSSKGDAAAIHAKGLEALGLII